LEGLPEAEPLTIGGTEPTKHIHNVAVPAEHKNRTLVFCFGGARDHPVLSTPLICMIYEPWIRFDSDVGDAQTPLAIAIEDLTITCGSQNYSNIVEFFGTLRKDDPDK
jgi:hypothetical protein